jgi:muramidase (phage lysozyme)
MNLLDRVRSWFAPKPEPERSFGGAGATDTWAESWDMSRRFSDALQHLNVQAFLHTIREGESSQGDEAYRMLVGGELFDDLSTHPRKLVYIPRLNLHSTAAGAYQILARTHDHLVVKHGFTDFRPRTQDAMAVALIAGRHALDDVIEGRFVDAVRKCNREWASFPDSPYGQGGLTWKRAHAVYASWGGRQ